MKPHSLDLRQRIVESYEAGEGSIRQLAKRYKVGPDAVCRLLKRYRETGSLQLSRATLFGFLRPFGEGNFSTCDLYIK